MIVMTPRERRMISGAISFWFLQSLTKHISRRSLQFPYVFSFFFFFFSFFFFALTYLTPEFSSIILDFCPPLCYAGYVGNVARNLEMVRGLQSPIFRGARNSVGFWDHSLFLFPNLSLSSSPTSLFLCLCPSSLPRFSIFSSIFISLRIRFSRASFTPLHYVYFFPVFSLLPTLIPSLRIPITYVCIYFLAPNIHTLLYLLLVLLIIVAIVRCFRVNLKKTNFTSISKCSNKPLISDKVVHTSASEHAFCVQMHTHNFIVHGNTQVAI